MYGPAGAATVIRRAGENLQPLFPGSPSPFAPTPPRR